MNTTTYKLGDTTLRVRSAIVSFWLEKGYGPSVREVGRMVGLKSSGSTIRHIHALAERGLIEFNPGIERSARPLSSHCPSCTCEVA